MTYDEAVRKLKQRLYKGELGLKHYYKLRAQLLKKRWVALDQPIAEKNLAAAPDLDNPDGLFDGKLPTF